MDDLPTTRYVKSDDVHIAYQVFGQGSLDLLFVTGFVSKIDAIWQSPDHSAFFRSLGSFCRVILFDKRGTGMSDRGSQIFTLEQRMHDVQAILDEVGSERAALFGVSEGGPMSLLYAATYPARTSALVLYGSYARRSWAPDYLFGWKDEQWERLFDNFEHHWGTPQSMAVTMFAPSAASNRQAAERLASYQRAAASPGAAIAIMRMNRDIDVRHVLPAIQVPTLILHRAAERVVDVEHARYMAERIPGAKLIELAGIDHNYILGDRDVLLDQVEVFLTGARHAQESERVLAQPSVPRGWATVLGADCWRPSMRMCVRRCGNTAGARSTPQATASSLPSTGRHEQYAVPVRFATHCAQLALRCAVVSTPVNANSRVTSSPASRYTSGLVLAHLPTQARFLSRQRCVIWSRGQGCNSRKGAPIRSRACQGPGYSLQRRGMNRLDGCPDRQIGVTSNAGFWHEVHGVAAAPEPR
jgi:pimeloyl-ACP methyl ester carboxylesterase